MLTHTHHGLLYATLVDYVATSSSTSSCNSSTMMDSSCVDIVSGRAVMFASAIACTIGKLFSLVN
jgi:hypothetical protein